MTKRILLAGETFVLTHRVTVGYDLSGSGSYANGATRFLAALREGGFTVDQLPSERCESEFPASFEALDAYDAVVLSDIGALSLLYTADTRAARPGVNGILLCGRLTALPNGQADLTNKFIHRMKIFLRPLK